MKNAWKSMVVAAVLSCGSASAGQPDATTVQVYKSPTCGCCSKWVDHMRASKFTVKATDTDDMASVKTRYKVPKSAESCHTSVIGGYVVEGHVPAADIRRMLKERPAIVGLAAPGMPVGSPGMEVPGQKPDAYDVIAFDKAGKSSVFASHNR